LADGVVITMIGRGQSDFARFPSFAARLYASLTRGRAIYEQQREIASDLAVRVDHGRILDVGTGPGYLLLELRRLNRSLELFGLDISPAMVDLARRNLPEHDAVIKLGSIQFAPFDDNFFDLITCTGSFYLWDQPVDCLNDVFRILKPGHAAILFETYRDCDRNAVRRAIAGNLRDENLARRLIAPRLFSKQLAMTYDTKEMETIFRKTRFARSYAMERIALAGVPAWVRIGLHKHL